MPSQEPEGLKFINCGVLCRLNTASVLTFPVDMQMRMTVGLWRSQRVLFCEQSADALVQGLGVSLLRKYMNKSHNVGVLGCVLCNL